MNESLINKILETLRSQRPCAVATVVATQGSSPRQVGAKMAVFKDGSIEGTIGGGALEKAAIGDALKALRRREPLLKEYRLDKRSGLQVCGGRVNVFFDVVVPRRKLIIAGAGHVGLALSLVAKVLGFEVWIVDNRRMFARAGRFPHADRILCGPYGQTLRKQAVDGSTAIVIVTHGHLHDEECLEAALRSCAGYVGMIGSQRKVRDIFARLAKKGFKRGALAKVHAPIGIDIGAESPEEIAVAIAAELIEVLRKT